MKVSIVTVCRNAGATIADTIASVNSQDYKNIEHIIIDGASIDNTLGIVRNSRNKSAIILSEPDCGIYDAMNKGIRLASGDIIGFLNADDVFVDATSISAIVNGFRSSGTNACYGDLVYFDEKRHQLFVRYYSSKKFSKRSLPYGMMPAHPTLYLRKEIFSEFGLFKKNYKIAADFEFVVRIFASSSIKAVHIPQILVNMRKGGVSTRGIKNTILLNKEIVRACAENNIKTNIFKVYMKYFRKIFEIKLDFFVKNI